MNMFTLMLRGGTSNLPKVGQFGKLLEFLATFEKLDKPPAEAQFNDGPNLITVTTKLCLHQLEEQLKKAGFDVTVGFTRTEGGRHDCNCLVAAE